MAKEKEPEPKIFDIEGRLIVKLIGTVEDIENHIRLLKRIYGAYRLNCSPILKNKYGNGYFCFINILSGVLSGGTESQ